MNRQLVLPHHFEPRRSANWNIRLGFHHGQGLSSVKIAELLGDGTGPATVRTMIQGADLPSPGHRLINIPTCFEYWKRDVLQGRADERRIAMSEMMRRVIDSALVLDDLYDAITDGRYD